MYIFLMNLSEIIIFFTTVLKLNYYIKKDMITDQSVLVAK